MKDEKYGVGTKHATNEGCRVEIIEKVDCKKRRVKFENGYEVIVFKRAIKKGEIKNPGHPSVYGVGHFGVGEYRANINEESTPEYKVWTGMLRRCYDKKTQEKYPNYKNVTVCEKWLNFQNFAKFYNDNHPKIEGIKFQLDKDLLQNDVKNKLYSPETCTFLPHNVNLFLANKQLNNTSGYIGVHWDKINKKWQARVGLFGEGK